MPQIVLDAINLIKGEVNGDKFLWDHEWYNEETGTMVTGIWKSTLESDSNRPAVVNEIDER